MNLFFRRDANLTKAVDRLAELIEKREENISRWHKAMEDVLKRAERATSEEVRQTQQRLADMMLEIPLILAALFALGSGTLVENGADSEIPAEAIFQRTYEALTLATDFGNACLEHVKVHHTEGEDEVLSPEECIEQHGSHVAENMEEEAMAWQALETLATASLAIVTRSPEQRARVREKTEFMNALAECPADSILHCLRTALNLLNNEEIIVLHPELQRGYRIRINNIGLNFELHTLLADALIGDPAQGWLPGQRPDPRVVAAAKDGPFPLRGEKGYDSFPNAEGAFNLWNWRGLQADGTLPDIDMVRNARKAVETGIDDDNFDTHWIWNEGQPADIEPFEGTRVILLGPPPYFRHWNAGRFFPHLNGELTVVDKLSEQQVRLWIAKIVTAVEK